MLVIWPQPTVERSVERAVQCALEINQECQNYVPKNSGIALNGNYKHDDAIRIL
jgi:hypothetical protein